VTALGRSILSLHQIAAIYRQLISGVELDTVTALFLEGIG